jgi:hypothetical protein
MTGIEKTRDFPPQMQGQSAFVPDEDAFLVSSLKSQPIKQHHWRSLKDSPSEKTQAVNQTYRETPLTYTSKSQGLLNFSAERGTFQIPFTREFFKRWLKDSAEMVKQEISKERDTKRQEVKKVREKLEAIFKDRVREMFLEVRAKQKSAKVKEPEITQR